MKRILGIDIGGVIVSYDTDLHAEFEGRMIPGATQGCFDAVKQLVTMFDDVVIISKCGQKMQEQSTWWLETTHFYTLTGVKSGNVYFCRQRPDKAPIASELGVTHFIDDKIEVLSHMKSVPTKYLFNPRPQDIKGYEEYLDQVIIVNSWDEILQHAKSN